MAKEKNQKEKREVVLNIIKDKLLINNPNYLAAYSAAVRGDMKLTKEFVEKLLKEETQNYDKQPLEEIQKQIMDIAYTSREDIIRDKINNQCCKRQYEDKSVGKSPLERKLAELFKGLEEDDYINMISNNYERFNDKK